MLLYNLWIYSQLTEDESILTDGGLDLIIETTKFWLNKAELGDDGRYHIDGVMGPDEYIYFAIETPGYILRLMPVE